MPYSLQLTISHEGKKRLLSLEGPSSCLFPHETAVSKFTQKIVKKFVVPIFNDSHIFIVL